MFENNKLRILVLLLVMCTEAVWAGNSFSVGAEYSEGDYGTGQTTRSWYLPVGWHYSQGDFSAALIVPYLRVEGSSLVTFDGRPLVPPGTGGNGMGGGVTGSGGTTHTASGIGDVVLSVGYQLQEERGGVPWLATRLKVKLGTADESEGLGTGENDYSLQLELASGMFYGFAGYRLQGDTATVDYNDVAYAAVALSFPLAREHEISVEYYTEEASLSGMDEVREATLSIAGALSSASDYSLYYIGGLSDSSADSVIGINIKKRLKTK